MRNSSVKCIHNFPRTDSGPLDVYYHDNNRLRLLFTAVFNTIPLSAATSVNYYLDYYRDSNFKNKL